jgi:hypothetical protein
MRLSNKTFLPYFDDRKTPSRMPTSTRHQPDIQKIKKIEFVVMPIEHIINLLDEEPGLKGP